MKTVCMLFLLVAMIATTNAQNYTIEFERTMAGAENFETIEPAFETNGEISWLIVIDKSIYRFVANDLLEDTSFIFPVTGIPLAVESFPFGVYGLASVYVAYHQGSNLNIGSYSDIQGQSTYQSLELDYLVGPTGMQISADHKAVITPMINNGTINGIRVGASYLWGEYGPNFELYENRTNWSTVVNSDLSSFGVQMPFFHVASGNLLDNVNPDICGFTDDFLSTPTRTDWGWVYEYSESSTMVIWTSSSSTRITTDKGIYDQLLVDNFDHSNLFDEIIYDANAIPLDETEAKHKHTACFRMAVDSPERVWLRSDLPNLQYYYKTENLLVFLNNDGEMTLVNASNGETTENINLNRAITATEFFTNPVTNTLGLIGRVHDTIVIYNFGSPTPVEEPVKTLPSSFTLAQNYPNPFNPTTTISFMLEKPGTVELSIYNVTGQKVSTLENRFMTAGEHNSLWDGKDENNNPVASGVYLYRLKTDNKSQTRKMILIN